MKLPPNRVRPMFEATGGTRSTSLDAEYVAGMQFGLVAPVVPTISIFANSSRAPTSHDPDPQT